MIYNRCIANSYWLLAPATMRAIRASEIGTYLYCRRAWWYRLQGFESSNKAELAAGTELHRAHGRKVLAASLLRALAVVLILAALVLLAAYLTAQVVAG